MVTFVPEFISVSEPSAAGPLAALITYGVANVPVPVMVIFVPEFIFVSEPLAPGVVGTVSK